MNTASAPVAAPVSAPSLTSLEVEVVDLFVQVARLLGQPRSVAEIYGLLFICSRPLAMDELMNRLDMSKGSASQGLKILRNLGAVRVVYVAGDRRDHYEAVTELRKMLARFLAERLTPYLDHGSMRLGRIEAAVRRLPEAQRDFAERRVGMLRAWGKNGRNVLPMVEKLLQ